MDSHILDTIKDSTKSKSWIIDVVFYFVSALLIAVIFSYGVFAVKVYLLNKKIDDTNKQIAMYGTPADKLSEKKLFDYKKEIDNFALIINDHKISSNIFSFMENNTLPNVWFLNFDMTESTSDIALNGESDTMESLAGQVKVFEENKDYIKSVNIMNSHVGTDGKVTFTLRLSLEPKIFTYVAPALTLPAVQPQNTPINNQ